MIDRSARHATFVIERIYAAAPARVFAAWAEPAIKARWFAGPGAWKLLERAIDFRVGGRERLVGAWPNGSVSTFDAVYRDIVPDQRIILVYDMQINERPISVSLATVELKPADQTPGPATRLTFTEQAVFLDDFDDPAGAGREKGTRALLDNLDAVLRRKPGEA
jgi:uncharacterized protein YndB with AHSA1/START domain